MKSIHLIFVFYMLSLYSILEDRQNEPNRAGPNAPLLAEPLRNVENPVSCVGQNSVSSSAQLLRRLMKSHRSRIFDRNLLRCPSDPNPLHLGRWFIAPPPQSPWLLFPIGYKRWESSSEGREQEKALALAKRRQFHLVSLDSPSKVFVFSFLHRPNGAHFVYLLDRFGARIALSWRPPIDLGWKMLVSLIQIL